MKLVIGKTGRKWGHKNVRVRVIDASAVPNKTYQFSLADATFEDAVEVVMTGVRAEIASRWPSEHANPCLTCPEWSFKLKKCCTKKPGPSCLVLSGGTKKQQQRSKS